MARRQDIILGYQNIDRDPAVPEPYTGRIEFEEPVYTAEEASYNLAQAQAYITARPTSRFGASDVLHWERVLAEATARESWAK